MATMAQMIGLVGKAGDPDTMTLEEPLAEPNQGEFIKAMYEELSDHIKQNNWRVIPLLNAPKHTKTIPMVCSMKHKCNSVGEIIKWKAQVYAGGHKSMESIDYWSTYSPIILWSTV